MTAGREIRVNTRLKCHRCAADGCTLSVPLQLLMCSSHWRKVPTGTQRRVWHWLNKIKSNPKQDHPEFELWVQRYEQAVADASKAASGRDI